MRVAVIGVGSLGQHHARILAALPEARLLAVVDRDAGRASEIAARHGVTALTDHRDLRPDLDAVTVAVPTSDHADVAADCLRRGYAVLVEKPMAATVQEAERLLAAAGATRRTLVVGHTERFNPVVRAAAARVRDARFIEAHRLGVFSDRSTDVDVVLDLMIHDLDIVLSIVGEMPDQIQAIGWSEFGGHDDVVHAHLTFPCGTVAHLTASRADVKPVREMTVRWTQTLAHLDFAARRTVVCMPKPDFYEAAQFFVNPPVAQIASLRERLHSDYFQVTETDHSAGPELLAVELEHFVACVRDRREPLVNGPRARDAVQLATSILHSAHSESALGLAKAA